MFQGFLTGLPGHPAQLSGVKSIRWADLPGRQDHGHHLRREQAVGEDAGPHDITPNSQAHARQLKDEYHPAVQSFFIFMPLVSSGSDGGGEAGQLTDRVYARSAKSARASLSHSCSG
jgi:hypothetical protein